MKQLNKKLAGYSVLAATLLVGNGKAEGQITYTDISPDATIDYPGGPTNFYLDLDDDGVNDFRFKADPPGYLSTAIQVYPLGYNKVATHAIHQTYCEFYVNCAGGEDFIDGIKIGPNSNPPNIFGSWSWWGIGLSYPVILRSKFGPWPAGAFGATPRYLGLRLQNGADFNYGWIRLSCPGIDNAIFFDYAYNTTPNEPIYTGSKCGTPDDVAIDSLSSNFARLTWSPIPEANNYTIQGKKVSASTTAEVIRNVPKVQRGGLQSGVSYEVRVRTNCAAGESAWSNWVELTTPVLKESLFNELAVYPNPANDQLFINGIEADTKLELFDLQGKLISEQVSASHASTISVEDLESGVYFLLLRNDKKMQSVKVIVE